MPEVAASFLASDFLHLADECALINKSEAAWYHLDVMDGRFVPNISFGLPVIEQITKATEKFCDVHLMIVEPEKYVERFKTAGADNITVHFEATTNLHSCIHQIKKMGIKAGVALNPHMPVSLLEDILADVDVVNLMSVNPGFGGQEFIPYTLEKIKQLRKMIDSKNYKALIEIDGGVTVENAAEILAAGTDVLVAGSSIFKAKDPLSAIKKMKNALLKKKGI